MSVKSLPGSNRYPSNAGFPLSGAIRRDRGTATASESGIEGKAGRFLRDPNLRAALYAEAEGKCVQCGEFLGFGWHADHIVPWSSTHRTNVFEMQAMCAACNERKGDKQMPRISQFEFDLGQFRRGQLEAFDVTTKRVLQGRETHTAIVLPTRYGKTDFMLMTGLYLMNQEAVSGMLIITPNLVLRNQVVNLDKLRSSLRRYRAKVERIRPDGTRSRGIDPYNIVDTPRIERLVPHAPIAATTSMVYNNIPLFSYWIDHLKHTTGVPPIVFVDEAHTASNLTAWGQTINALAEAGSFIVLCTATPYRSDGLPIPGFQVTTTYEDELTKRQQVGAHVYQMRGRRVVHLLTAHHTTTFQEAWQESVICGISREPFDVNLREHGIVGYSDQWLSELGERDARRALSKVVRSPEAVRTGVKKLLRNLSIRQKDAPETAGIVFVGNDDGRDSETGDDDYEANRYANLVKRIVQEECKASSGTRELNAVIATSSVGDASQVIEDFQKGTGDILIVKMMASAGLDIARLKVALDLSTVRTAGSFVQRTMRICTRWERDGRAPILKALYITPDDSMGREYYQRLIHDLGGDASTVVWEEGEELTDGAGPESPQPPLTEYEVIGTALGNVLEDEDGTVGPGNLLPVVDSLLDDLPFTTREIGKGRLSNRLYEAVREAGGVIADESIESAPPQLTATAEGDDLVDNTQQRMELKRRQLVRLVKRHVAFKITQDKDRTGQAMQWMWRDLYKRAGVPWRRGIEPGQLLKSLDEPTLDKLFHTMREISDGGID